MSDPHFTVVQADGPVSVVELKLPLALDSSEFDELNESMLSLVQENPNTGWVIDLGRVSYMGSAMLGLMVNLRQRVRAAGGRLVLCSMPPSLMRIFRTCCMERLFTIAKSRPEAIKFAR